jgi:hypothetical protein
LKRFGIKTLLLLVAVVAVGFWLFDDGFQVIYAEDLSAEYRLTVSSRKSTEPNLTELKITYHYPPAIGMFMVDSFKIATSNERIEFRSFTDAKTGIKWVCDPNDAGLVFMFSPTTDDLFHTGRDGGWYGTTTTEWSTIFNDIASRTPEMPYTALPAPAIAR